MASPRLFSGWGGADCSVPGLDGIPRLAGKSTREMRREPHAAVHVSRARLPAAEHRGKRPWDEPETSARGDGDDEADLRRENAKLTMCVVELRESEALLTKELRRLRMEYDKAVLERGRRILAASADSKLQQAEAKQARAAQAVVAAASATKGAAKAPSTGTGTTSEVHRLRLLLDKSWEESKESREARKRDVDELQAQGERDARALAEALLSNEQLSSGLLVARTELRAAHSKVNSLEQDFRGAQADAERRAAQAEAQAATSERALRLAKGAAKTDVGALRKELARRSSDLEAMAADAAQASAQREKEQHEQFAAFRELWTKTSDAADAHTAFRVSLQKELGGAVAAGGGAAGGTVAGVDTDARLLEATRRAVEGAAQQTSLREAAERKYASSEARLMKSLEKLEVATEQLEGLRQTSDNFSAMSTSQYQKWWLDFQAIKIKVEQKRAFQAATKQQVMRVNAVASASQKGTSWKRPDPWNSARVDAAKARAGVVSLARPSLLGGGGASQLLASSASMSSLHFAPPLP